jgi:anti-sigma regulatory factor (Ser/Thr protein kinase)
VSDQLGTVPPAGVRDQSTGVRLRFTANPAHVRTVRLLAVTMARRAGVDESLLDEVRLAVGEACSRAVQRHRVSGVLAPVAVTITDTGGQFTVSVTDCVPSSDMPPAPSVAGDLVLSHAEPVAPPAEASAVVLQPPPLPPEVGLAVIAGLVDDVDIATGPDGVTVTMRWPTAV